ncbi:MAG: cytochrome P450 [Desulfurellaceae bacterium]|nr:cytochrome P450 [Desulfurellaceae bacterium]
MGNGPLTSEGAVWRRRRRLAQPAFHRRQVENFAATMVKETTAMLERWARVQWVAKPLDVMAEMQDLAALIVGRALFSTDLSTGYTDTMRRSLWIILEYLSRRTQRPLSLPLWVPTPANRRFRKATRLSVASG